MEITLTAIFEPVSEAEGGGYVAYTEELPEAISEGDTLDEARENLRDAIALVLETNWQTTENSVQGKHVTREKIRALVA